LRLSEPAASSVQHWCVLLPSITSLNLTLVQTKALDLPKEHEMDPKDKYTVFSPHHRGYRKGIHKVPKWTRVCTHTHLSRYLRVDLRLSLVDHPEDKPERILG
jgi:hypothetical protein